VEAAELVEALGGTEPTSPRVLSVQREAKADILVTADMTVQMEANHRLVSALQNIPEGMVAVAAMAAAAAGVLLALMEQEITDLIPIKEQAVQADQVMLAPGAQEDLAAATEIVVLLAVRAPN
jgi:Ni,Fe-hydrogenase III small subunit